MSIFVMHPISFTKSVPDQNLHQAEFLLQKLERNLASLPPLTNSSLEKRKNLLIALLQENDAEDREKSDREVAKIRSAIQEREIELQKLKARLKSEIDKMVDEPNNNLSLKEALAWKHKASLNLDGNRVDCEHRHAQFISESQQVTNQIRKIRSNQIEWEKELRALETEEKRLFKPDSTAEIKEDLAQISSKINQLKKDAAETNIPNAIARLEKEVDEINAKIEGLTSSFGSLKLDLPKGTSKKKSKKKKQPKDELSNLFQEIEQTLDEKTKRLKKIKKIQKEIDNLKAREDSSSQKLENEKKRLSIQEKRENRIAELKSILEDERNLLNQRQQRFDVLKTEIEEVKQTQEEIQLKQQFLNKQQNLIERIQAQIEEVRTLTHQLNSKLETITPSSFIWTSSIVRRIKKMRQTLSIHNPLMLLFLPLACFNRYQLGLHIRKDLIRVEQTFIELGLLDQDYVESVDVFNRRNRKGQMLCPDILSC